MWNNHLSLAVMHAYPMYLPWARQPLDPDVVPFTCALTTALSGKPTLMEEWGGCTVGPDEASTMWEWTMWEQPRQQFMAGEDELAAYVDAVLPRLVNVDATGALLWCFADDAPELWDRPPCDEVKHEATRRVELPYEADTFYQAPHEHAVQLFDAVGAGNTP